MTHAIAYRVGPTLVLGALFVFAARAACAEEGSPAAPPAPAAAPARAAAAPAPQDEARPAEAKPAETQPPAAPSPEGKPSEAKPAETKPAEAKPLKAPARRTLSPEEIRQLPVFTRLDDATLQEILEKGKALLGDVKDNTFDYDEEAFYWLLHLVSRLKPDLLTPDAEPLPYSALLAMPSLYRGEPVTIRGAYLTVEKHRVPALALQKDVPFIYPCTVKEHPADQNRPLATVIVTEDPTTYLRSGDDVYVKGYFYKIRRYQGTRGEGFAPMIIAQRLVPADQTSATEAPATGDRPTGAFSDPTFMIALGIVAVLLGAFITLRVLIRKAKHDGTDKRSTKVHRFRLRRPDRPAPPAGGGPGGAGGGPKP